MDLNTSIQYLKGVGPKRAKILEKLGIKTLEELLYYFPRAYEDRSRFSPLGDLEDGVSATIRVQVIKNHVRRTYKGMSMLDVLVTDHKKLFNVTYFRQDYLAKTLSPGVDVIFSGRVERYKRLQMTNPAYEILTGDEEDLLHTGRIVPIYSLTEQMNQRRLRYMIKTVLDLCADKIEENIPRGLLDKYGLMDKILAMRTIHFPEKESAIDSARKRLVFEEFLLLQIGIVLARKNQKKVEKGIVHKTEQLFKGFQKSLPFALTGAQKRVIKEIETDMKSAKPMNRLLQGDVGSGKTIVAVAACLISVDGGYQTALMVPSEILAEQHYVNLQDLLVPMGLRVGLLVGSMRKKDRDEECERIRSQDVDIVIGTHALLQEDVVFKKLGLIIIDEQHKFGVSQRMVFRQKGAMVPDTLVMTATPIPRTLALTVYGDLDVSVIDELPPGRKQILTYWVGEKKREAMYGFIKKNITQGRQVYIIYPLVEESEKIDLKAVTQVFDRMQGKVFREFRLGLIHGRLSREEKENVMRSFKKHDYDVLLSTTIIEVGIDVPNATVMVIEHADRFGLAQLHQLRGRVGRGTDQSYCILVSDARSENAKERLETMAKTSDGFQLAEKDLVIRGPGEFFGTRQHGMPDLRIGDIVEDIRVLEQARQEAVCILKHDPELNHQEHQGLKREMKMKFKTRLELFKS